MKVRLAVVFAVMGACGQVSDPPPAATRSASMRKPARVAASCRRRSPGYDYVILPHGPTIPRPPGVQDSGSQFVQLTWLFTTQPERLVEGGTVSLPLALPRSVQTWTYDIGAAELLATPVGELPTLHLVPRRPPRDARGDLAAEIWIAPSLQYLPVRILVRQSAETWLDLLLDALPMQGEAPPR